MISCRQEKQEQRQLDQIRALPNKTNVIHRMHKWRPTKYSFVFVLIRPTSLVLKEHFFCILSVLTRLVSLIRTKTKEYFFGRHLRIRSIPITHELFIVKGANKTTTKKRIEGVRKKLTNKTIYDIASKLAQFQPRNLLTSSACFKILWLHADDATKTLKCMSVSFQWV